MSVPGLPPDGLIDGLRARQYTPAQPTFRRGRWGRRYGHSRASSTPSAIATLQPPPASSHTHFSERFSKIQEYHTQN